ncbi:hypothetical protein OE88DRAFT_1664193 [Heliocybe sulcata]|uniref:BTB domain-containing protein n=1 Tax=Heliocybe sulcata TaxID=5364 RepID=A0A5C3MSF9_9AGAM|nr:hypothetical protein OE88DRAFT_1664193 [Heliocybe sulcata]
MESSRKSGWQPTEPLFQEDPTADVILRSTDGADFRAHKLMLSIASPLFRDMFSVGGASNSMPARHDMQPPDDRVVPMTEERAEVVEKLLRLCYPVKGPRWENAAELHPVLMAAIKYQLEGVVETLRRELVAPRFLESEPLRVFAIACHAKFTNDARVAARHALSHPILLEEAPTELSSITAFSLYRFLQFRDKCSKAAAELTTDSSDSSCMGWVPDCDCDWVWFKCQKHSWRPRSVRFDEYVVKWWRTYLSSARAALTQNPSGSSATREETLKAALEEASTCSNCSSKAYMDLTRFSRRLADAVDRKVNEIANTFDFCEA